MKRLAIFVLALGLLLPATVQANERCILPVGYLEQIETDIGSYGNSIAEVDPENVVALADFLIELIKLRQSYIDMTENMPECGLRLHIYFVSLITNMQDRTGLAIALHADPDRTEHYLLEIDLISGRLAVQLQIVMLELEHLQDIPPLAVRYIDTEAINVRSGPGPDTESLGVLEQGDRVEVITIDLDDYDNVWYEFYFEDTTGWVLGELTSDHPR